MTNRLLNFLRENRPLSSKSEVVRRLEVQSRISIALARAAATAATRVIDPSNPHSWEFSGFSQNGEDGIFDYLVSKLENPTRYFLEIGGSNGLENNSSWWAYARRYSGVMVEGNPVLSSQARSIYETSNWGVKCLNLFLEKSNVHLVLDAMTCHEPDVMSLDIDGIDYYVAEALFDKGLRPRVVGVEYNSSFGPDRAITVPYRPCFNRREAHPSGNYYGVSIAGWKRFFENRNYCFVTLDSNGVNTFFVDRAHFSREICESWKPSEFRENYTLAASSWQEQFAAMKDMDWVEI